MEILTVIWSVLSFALGLFWSLIWFVLRDALSTVVWVFIVFWLLLSVRYRSFTSGFFALLRYARFGFSIFWRWLRGQSVSQATISRSYETDRMERKRALRRMPFGYMSLSEQFNMILVGAIYLLFSA